MLQICNIYDIIVTVSWLTDIWRPKIQYTENTSKDGTVSGDNLWTKCESCGEMDYKQTWNNNLKVCSKCQFHSKMSAKERIIHLFGEEYQIINIPNKGVDPIKFKDSKKYTDRIQAAGTEDNFYEAITVARGKLDKQDTIVAVMDFSFIGGSMSMYVGESIVQAAKIAQLNNIPFICFTASGGARMQEGLYALMQMPRTTLAVEQLKSKGVPFIIVLTNPTMGGVTASFAMLGDITFAEPGATIGFSGRRVIENTVKEKLPENFQTSQHQYECGFVDQVIHRHDIKNSLISLLNKIVK